MEVTSGKRLVESGKTRVCRTLKITDWHWGGRFCRHCSRYADRKILYWESSLPQGRFKRYLRSKLYSGIHACIFVYAWAVITRTGRNFSRQIRLERSSQVSSSHAFHVGHIRQDQSRRYVDSNSRRSHRILAGTMFGICQMLRYAAAVIVPSILAIAHAMRIWSHTYVKASVAELQVLSEYAVLKLRFAQMPWIYIRFQRCRQVSSCTFCVEKINI